MSFDEISSRGGLAATNSTSKITEFGNRLLSSFNMTQDDVLNLDTRVAEAEMAKSQELEESREKKAEASRMKTAETNRKRDARWNNEKSKKKFTYVQSKKGWVSASQVDVNETIYIGTSTGTSTTAHTVPVIEKSVKPVRKTPTRVSLKDKSPEEIKARKALQKRTLRAANKKQPEKPKVKKPYAKKRKKQIVSTSIGTTSTSTAQSCPVLEEHVLPVSKNPYHNSQSQEDKKKQRNFTERLRYRARKKASEQPVSKKPKLSRAQEEAKKTKSAKSKYNMNTDKKKIHIENNRTVLPHVVNKTPVHLPVAESAGTVPIITPTKNIHTKNIFFMILQQVLRRYQMIL